MLQEYLEVGRVVGTHGLRGELRVEPWSDTPDFLTAFQTLYWNKGASPVRVLGARVHKRIVLLTLEGVDTVEKGDILRGKVLSIARKDAVLPEGRYFIQDLLGMRVQDADTAQVYGTVSDVLKTGANDVYQITAQDGKQYLFPAVPAMLVQTDVPGRTMLVRPIKGIFDDED